MGTATISLASKPEPRFKDVWASSRIWLGLIVNELSIDPPGRARNWWACSPFKPGKRKPINQPSSSEPSSFTKKRSKGLLASGLGLGVKPSRLLKSPTTIWSVIRNPDWTSINCSKACPPPSLKPSGSESLPCKASRAGEPSGSSIDRRPERSLTPLSMTLISSPSVPSLKSYWWI